MQPIGSMSEKVAMLIHRAAALNRDVGPQCGKGFLEAGRAVDDLARHGDVTGLAKRCIEALEQWPDGAGLREFLPEQLNRPGVGDAIRQSIHVTLRQRG
jgi:hypothetical protein